MSHPASLSEPGAQHNPAAQQAVAGVLAETDQRLRAPSAGNLEEALPQLAAAVEYLRGVPAGTPLPGVSQRQIGQLRLLAEHAAAYYLGMAATLSSAAGGYDQSGNTTAPAAGRVSVEA